MLQGVLPTMVSSLPPNSNKILINYQIILAVYYTIADIVLLCQCFYYRGFTWKDEVIPPAKPNGIGEPTERTGLLSPNHGISERERRPSTWSDVSHHLSPVVPLIDAPRTTDPPAVGRLKPTTPPPSNDNESVCYPYGLRSRYPGLVYQQPLPRRAAPPQAS